MTSKCILLYNISFQFGMRYLYYISIQFCYNYNISRYIILIIKKRLIYISFPVNSVLQRHCFSKSIFIIFSLHWHIFMPVYMISGTRGTLSTKLLRTRQNYIHINIITAETQVFKWKVLNSSRLAVESLLRVLS